MKWYMKTKQDLINFYAYAIWKIYTKEGIYNTPESNYKRACEVVNYNYDTEEKIQERIKQVFKNG